MKDFQLTTPVLIIGFNRPDLTRTVFDSVRAARPGKLYYYVDAAADESNASKVSQTREIINRVDWDCKIKTFFPEKNLGHTYGPIAAINWIFKENERAIILEDDCVPNLSFFRYCQELLEYYKGDERVFSIAGAVYLDPMPKLKYSYWFATLTSTWGWASWRRSWEKLDFSMSKWPALRKTNWLATKIGNAYIANNYFRTFEKTYKSLNTRKFVGWDTVFHYTMMLNNSYDVRPAVNLVSNIGFREDASHTKQKTSFADFPTKEMEFPLKHPRKVVPSLALEAEFYKQHDKNYNLAKFYLKAMIKTPLNFATRLVRRALRILKKTVKVFSLQSDYRFSFRDYSIYIFDELAHRKIKIQELGNDEALSHLQIEDFNFFWPKNQNRKELGGIWQEVFNPSILNPHSYEFKEGTINPGDVVIDAGVCEGFFVHYARKKNAKVYGFEPLGILKRCLDKTFLKEIETGHVKLFQNLLGSENRITGISSNPDMLCLSAEDELNGEKCEMVTFDKWLEQNKIPKIDFIKMDIEGAEVEAFKGAEKIIRYFKPKLAIAVYHNYENAKLIKGLLLRYRPDYNIRFSGIWDIDEVKPRPYMIYAY